MFESYRAVLSLSVRFWFFARFSSPARVSFCGSLCHLHIPTKPARGRAIKMGLVAKETRINPQFRDRVQTKSDVRLPSLLLVGFARTPESGKISTLSRKRYLERICVCTVIFALLSKHLLKQFLKTTINTRFNIIIHFFIFSSEQGNGNSQPMLIKKSI